MKRKHGGGRRKITVWGPGARNYYYMVGDTCMKIARSRTTAREFFVEYAREELRKRHSDPEYTPDIGDFSIIDGVDFRVKYLKTRRPFENAVPQNVKPHLKQPHEHIYIFCGSSLVGVAWMWSETIRVILEAQDAGAHPEYFLLVAGRREKFDIESLPGCSAAELEALNRRSRERREFVEARKQRAARQQPDTTYSAYKLSVRHYENATMEERLARRMKKESENEEFE